MKHLKTLKQKGYEGIDYSLEISLYEYGLAWEKTKTGYTFIVGIRMDENCEYTHFDCIGLEDNEINDFNISPFSFDDVAKCCGMSVSEWEKLPFPQKIYDLANYYGTENVFGCTNWEGFEIKE